MRRAAARWLWCFSRDERGSVFLIVGTFLILLLFVGMATDFGIVLRYRRAMQNACDSGVLAGAQNLLDGTIPAATGTAQTFAANDMTQNNIQWDNPWDSAHIQTQDANGQPDSVSPNQLWMSIHATVPLFFLALVQPSMPVAVQCAARVVPAGEAGLWPLGMDYNQWLKIWQNLNQGCTYPGVGGGSCTAQCPVIGVTPVPSACTDPTNFPPIPGCTACAPGDIQLSFAVSNTQWGSGNSGTLNMTNANCTGGGASNLACVFALGSGTTPSGGVIPPPYCNTPPAPPATIPPAQGPKGGLNYPNGGWFACSIVQSKTGATIGSASGGTYGTGINGGINYICSNYNNPLSYLQSPPDPAHPNTNLTWVITLPLINPDAFTNNNGTSAAMDIVAFANFEIDCGAFLAQTGGWSLGGGTPSIVGRFVKWASPTATVGNPNGIDTGVETVILVQ